MKEALGNEGFHDEVYRQGGFYGEARAG